MVRKNAGPSQTALLDFLTDPAAMASRFGNSPGELFNAYAQRVMAADPSIAAQLRGQLGGPASTLPRPSLPSALAALNVAGAPGAKLNGHPVMSSWGTLARAAWHKADRSGPRNVWRERVGVEGGYLVGEELRSDLVMASLESAVMRPGATVLPMGALRVGIPAVDDETHAGTPEAVLGGISWAWTTEGQLITGTQPAFGRIFLNARKLAGYVGPIGNELCEDAAALEVFFRQVAPKGYALVEDSAFINGTGVGQPQGILNASAAINVTRSASSHVSFADIPAMLARLLPQSLNRACWICSQSTLIDMLSVYQNFGSATTGTIPPSMWVERRPSGWTLLGMPLYVTEHSTAVGSRGDLTLVDRSFYVIGDRLELAIDSTDAGQTFVEDATEFRLTARLDGRLWLQNPVTPEHGASTLSAVVILN